MKKALTVVLSIIMGVLLMFGVVACGDKKDNTQTVKDAIDTIRLLYEDEAEETLKDYKVNGRVKVGDDFYPIAWSVSSTAANYQEYVSIGEMNPDDDNQCTVTIKRGAERIDYTLKATVTIGKTSDSVEFNHYIPAALAEGTNVIVTMEEYAGANSWETDGSVVYDTVNMDANVTVKLTAAKPNATYGQNTGKYYANGKNWRIYQNEEPSVTFTAAEGYKIVTVKITYEINKTGILTSADGETQYASDEAITVNAPTVSFTVGNTGDVTNGQVRITAIEVVYNTLGADEHVHAWGNYAHVANTWTHTGTCTGEGCAEQQTFNCKAENNVCKDCGYTYTESEILTALFALEAGKSLNGTYQLTGKITAIEDISVNYKNATFTVKVGEKEVIAYRAKGDSYYNKIRANDTVTVTGALKNYSGKFEFDQGCQITALTPVGDIESHVHTFSYTHVADSWNHTVACTVTGCGLTMTNTCEPENNKCTNCGYTYTEEEILTALFALEAGKYLPGTYQLTAAASNVSADTDFKNVTFTMTFGDKTVEAYRAKGTGYDTLKDGDVVTVSGELMHYVKGTTDKFEFDQGCAIVKIEQGGSTGDEHQHTFAPEWTKTETQHYHAATCEHTTEKADEAEHTFIENTCSVCGYVRTEPSHEHTWSYAHVANTWTHTKSCAEAGCTAAPETVDCAPVLNVCPDCNTEYTEAQILEALFALDSGKSLPGTYQLKGTVTEIIKLDTTNQNQFITFNMTVGDKTVQAYKAKGENYDTIVTSDAVTITGKLKRYNNTYEFDSGCQITAIEKGTHVHDFVYELDATDTTKHTKTCKGCRETFEAEDHVFGEDTVCDNCKYDNSVSSLYTLDTSTEQGSNSGYAGNCDITLNGITWNVEGNTKINPWRFGGRNITGVDRKLTAKTAISGKVTKIDIAFGDCNITVNSVTLQVFKVDPTTEGATAAYTKTVAFEANTTVTVEAGADEDWSNCYFRLVFNVTSGSSNKYVTVTKMVFYSSKEE